MDSVQNNIRTMNRISTQSFGEAFALGNLDDTETDFMT
jgi:hypothetical protein